MNPVNTSILAQELEPLNAQIEVVRERIESLEGELCIAEAELDALSAEKMRFNALQDVCEALDKLSSLEAPELFWDELPGVENPTGLVENLRKKVEHFEDEIRGGLEKQNVLKERIEQAYEELTLLNGEVLDAHAREERRLDEFAIEREITSLPGRVVIMPWSGNAESERYFRRALLVALLISFFFGTIIPLVTVAVPDRSATVVEIPERLAMLVKKEPPRPEPVPMPEPPPVEDKEEPQKKSEEKKPEKTKKPVKKKTEVAAAKGGKKAARKKAESTGVLAFKDTFKDLMDEPPVAKLGTEARINKKAPLAAGQARAQRSLVAAQATASSGGFNNSTVSRNLGVGGSGGNGERIGGVAFARVESAVAGLTAEADRPLSDGPGPARTDEEIQIVFDRYKATLYRIYNKELRKDPTLRGKLLLRLTIEPGGEISLCEVDSTDLASSVLVAKIVDRVKRFNFGAKEDVPKITILYPIDFLPSG